MDIYALALSIAYSNKIGKQIKEELAFKIQIESNRDILNTTGEEKIFYFLPKQVGKPQNGYDEYIYFNNNWELMGGTDVDLSDYYTKSEINSMLTLKQQKKIYFEHPRGRLDTNENPTHDDGSDYEYNDMFYWNGNIYIYKNVSYVSGGQTIRYCDYRRISKGTYTVSNQPNLYVPPSSESFSSYINSYGEGEYLYLFVESLYSSSGLARIFLCTSARASSSGWAYTWKEIQLDVYSKSETNTLLNAKENISNKVIALSSESTDAQYPSAKCTFDAINAKVPFIIECDITSSGANSDISLGVSVSNPTATFGQILSAYSQGRSIYIRATMDMGDYGFGTILVPCIGSVQDNYGDIGKIGFNAPINKGIMSLIYPSWDRYDCFIEFSCDGNSQYSSAIFCTSAAIADEIGDIEALLSQV